MVNDPQVFESHYLEEDFVGGRNEIGRENGLGVGGQEMINLILEILGWM